MSVHSRATAIAFMLALLATALVYWPGLDGPYLFDDYGNIEAVDRWHAGDQGLALTLLPNEASVVFSRPLSMASFVASAWITGATPFSYKLGNLMVHLACGMLVFFLLRRCLSADRGFKGNAGAVAVFLAALWLLHPLHSSTVLYIVQRMAQLSTLLTLAALLAYLIGRQCLDEGRKGWAVTLLFGVFPLLLVAGLLAKQNAAVAPYLCAVLEIAYLRARRPQRNVVLTFFAVFALLPAAGATLLMYARPEVFLSGYADWDFTWAERLLSQPRALVHYMYRTVVPNGPAMGLYTDDFAVSTNWLNPTTTLPSLILLAAMTAAAIWVRRGAPSIFAGWGLFLIAHGVESSFLPLEMYYEHRNYLPSVGLLLASTGVANLLATRAATLRTTAWRILGLAVLLVLAFATLGRALVWRTEESIVAQALAQHPESMRAMIDQGTIHIKQRQYDSAIEVTEPLRRSADQRKRVVGHLHRVAVECMRDGMVDPLGMSRAVENAMPRLTVYEAHMTRLLLLGTSDGTCGQYGTRYLAAGIEAIVEEGTTGQAANSISNAMRLAAAQLYARAGAWGDAERLARDAWGSRTYTPAGALLVRFLVRKGDLRAAEAAIAELETSVRSIDTIGQSELTVLRALVTGAKRQDLPE